MRNDERLRTIYEVMAPYIVRSERNWREYLTFASRFHKQSFDNILLVYAQDEDVTVLASKKQWASVGRNLISRPKGIAVCVYSNARLTLDYLFDISQTVGKEIHPTDWQLSDEMQKVLGERLTFSHGFQAQPFPDLLYALAREAVGENYEHYLQGLRQETRNHLFAEIPAGGFESQYIQLLTDSVSYFIGKKCHLPDETIRMGDGMATVNHFNTVPLVAHLGMAVTSISKAVLLEMERNIRIINRERKVQYEQAEHQSELQGTGRDASPRPANLQQQRGGQAPGPIRADGAGISQGQSAGAIYDFENGWQSDGGHAPGAGRGHGEDRGPDPADASAGTDAADRGHSGTDTPPERPEADGGGNGTPDHRADPPLTEEQPHTEAPQGAEHEGEPPAQDGSLSASPKVEHHFSDEEVRRHYEHMERLHPSEYKRLRETFGHITDDELGAASLDGVLSADGLARFIPGLFALKEKMPKKGRLAYKLLPEEVKAELDAFISSLKTDCKYIGDLVNEYADAKCQLSMLYDADPAHVEEQRQKGIAEADKLIANKVLEAIHTMLRKDRETGSFEYAEARKAYYTERLICEILMALEQNAVSMGMKYDDCQKAMGGDLSKAAKRNGIYGTRTGAWNHNQCAAQKKNRKS